MYSIFQYFCTGWDLASAIWASFISARNDFNKFQFSECYVFTNSLLNSVDIFAGVVSYIQYTRTLNKVYTVLWLTFYCIYSYILVAACVDRGLCPRERQFCFKAVACLALYERSNSICIFFHANWFSRLRMPDRAGLCAGHVKLLSGNFT